MNLEKKFEEIEWVEKINLGDAGWTEYEFHIPREQAEQCVQICDEFAVGFAEWFKEYPNNQPKGFNGKEFEYYTTTELLEIYKQGL